MLHCTVLGLLPGAARLPISVHKFGCLVSHYFVYQLPVYRMLYQMRNLVFAGLGSV